MHTDPVFGLTIVLKQAARRDGRKEFFAMPADRVPGRRARFLYHAPARDAYPGAGEVRP
jgi:hypothetical protein